MLCMCTHHWSHPIQTHNTHYVLPGPVHPPSGYSRESAVSGNYTQNVFSGTKALEGPFGVIEADGHSELL